MTNFSLSEEQLESIKTMLCSESEADRQQAGQLLTIAQVTELDLSDTEVTGAGLTHLVGMTNLTSLNLRSCPQITDADMAHLSGLINLTSLNLRFCEAITDAGLSQLGGLSNLTALDLGRTAITDAGLLHVSKLISLSNLDLYGCKHVTDIGLKHLSKLQNLTVLSFQFAGGEITDNGLSYIGDISSLKELDLSYCEGITEYGLASLLKLQSLDKLYISGSSITSAGLLHLSKIESLTRLDLSETDISDEGLSHISVLVRLEELGLFSTSIADKGVSYLSHLKQLRELHLSETLVTDRGLACLSNLTNLVYLGIYNCKNITESGLSSLLGLTNLEELDLDGCEGISDSVKEDPLAYLGQVREQIEKSKKLLCSESETDRQEAVEQLKSARVATFDLSGTAITDAGLSHLSSLTNLTSLKLSRCDGVTDAGLAHLSGLTSLTSLDVSGCKGITDAGLPDLSGLTNLESLDLSETLITDDGLAHLWPLSSSGAGGNLTWLSLHTCPRLCLVHATEDTSLASLDACNPSCPSERLSSIYTSLTDGSYAQSRMCKLLASNVNLPSDILEKLLESEYRWVREAAAANPILSQSQINELVSAGDRYVLKGLIKHPNINKMAIDDINSRLSDKSKYPIETDDYILSCRVSSLIECVGGSVDDDEVAQALMKEIGWDNYVRTGEGENELDWYDYDNQWHYQGVPDVINKVTYPDNTFDHFHLHLDKPDFELDSKYKPLFLQVAQCFDGYGYDELEEPLEELEYEFEPKYLEANAALDGVGMGSEDVIESYEYKSPSGDWYEFENDFGSGSGGASYNVDIYLYVYDHGKYKLFEYDEVLKEIKESIDLNEEEEEAEDQIIDFLREKYGE